MKKVLFSNPEYDDALNRLDSLMKEAENMSNADHKVLIYNILQYFDSIHREPLLRLMKLLEGHETIMKEIQSDATLNQLCGLYDIPLVASSTEKNGAVGFVPAAEVKLMTPVKRKDWLELGNVYEMKDQTLYAKNYERVNFLVSRVGSEVFAIQNQCDGSVLPIDKGRLEDHYIICPWHGCKYDLKTGISINNSQKRIEIFPVEIGADGLVKVEIAY